MKDLDVICVDDPAIFRFDKFHRNETTGAFFP